jgi:uncharacterized protein YcsI (UPF0317 family)
MRGVGKPVQAQRERARPGVKQPELKIIGPQRACRIADEAAITSRYPAVHGSQLDIAVLAAVFVDGLRPDFACRGDQG